ncbi:MAG: sugar ABC transporter substrate-binding protein [Leptolinea sp.]
MNKKSVKTVLMFVVMATMLLSTVQCAPAPAPAAPAAPAEAAPAAPKATDAPAPAPTAEPAKPVMVEKPYDGVELSFACMTDQYVATFRYLLPKFTEKTGIKVAMDELGYVDLYQKLTADFVAHTAQYDLMTTDIVWSGQFAANKNTLLLSDLIEANKDTLKPEDIPAVMWTQGEYLGKQYSFPLGGYANVLNFRKDLFEAKGIKPPTTQEELFDAAKALNDPANGVNGIALLGAGSAGAQDYMAFVQQHGGSILDKDGKVKVNTPENAKTLDFFASLFKYAPDGNADYWWDQRETAFREGKVAMMEGWSIARNDYEDATMSKVVGKVDITKAPVSAGMTAQYGFGGWGIGINADSDKKKQEAAWEFIKWLASPDVQKDWVLHRGPPLRLSTMKDADVIKALPWMPMLEESFIKGNGDYRPRIPQYSIIESALGTYVNSFLVGKEKSAQGALDKAQAQIEKDWK